MTKSLASTMWLLLIRMILVFVMGRLLTGVIMDYYAGIAEGRQHLAPPRPRPSRRIPSRRIWNWI